ncbi:MAG: molybdopterin-dependent oxidoreductase [Gemmatimonas sp.]|nr:molybdopterin-dependent oxidoreductase [Gemmatimonas sp.]
MSENHKVIGKDFPLKDLEAKVTGRARFTEDFRVEGMAFAKLLLSPMPRARVRQIDATAALAMEGVLGILTADELDIVSTDGVRQGVIESAGERVLTNEPFYQGQPVAAIAAVDEDAAAEAIDRLRVDYEILPFVLDPLESLRPGGRNARDEGNVYDGQSLRDLKWTPADMEAIDRGGWPLDPEYTSSWEKGDLAAAFAAADLIIEEPIYHQSVTHHPLEPRSALAYWQNGKLYLHCSTQSIAQMKRRKAADMQIEEEDFVLISQYCGGGFGSKNEGVPTDLIPALLSRKLGGRPVMLRVTRDEESAFGRARPGLQGFVRLGFRSNGRIAGIDLSLVLDSGPIRSQGDHSSFANYASLQYQPEAMRFRGITVATNTPPRGAQQAPGGFPMVTMMEPLMGRAARELGLDRLELMRINAPRGAASYGPQEAYITGSFAPEAIDRARELFRWEEKKQLSGQTNGSKVTGIGAALTTYGAGDIEFDGLLVIRPDGRLTVHQGIGNLGCHSVIDTARAAAEVLSQPWEEVDVVWGDTSRGAPWSSRQGGTRTTHAHTRANHAAAMDARRKLQEIAARDLGGSADSYEVDAGRVYRLDSPGTGMTLGRAAERAIELGGRYDGHELPEDIDAMTVAGARLLVGQGLMGVAKDNYGRDGSTYSFVVGLCHLELDRETGVIEVKEYLAVADCGTIMNPRGLQGQLLGGGTRGMSVVRFEKWAYDPQWGINANHRLYTAKPVTILDVPTTMDWAALDIPDPQTPVGAKGVAESTIGGGGGALIDAVADALGGRVPQRRPLTPDIILSMLEGFGTGHRPLQTHA